MPIMRCPSCGKPNPDFLDVCQYCEKPLHPATPASPAPAQRPGADETLVSAAAVRCPSCGRGNPAHVEVCQHCQARLKPLLAGGAAPAAPDVEADGSAITLMHRLRSMGAGTPAAEPPAEPEEPADPTPANWMSRLRGVGETTPDASALEPDDTAQPSPSEPQAPAQEPDWMWTGAPSEPDAPPPDQPPLAAPTPGSADLPDWLRDANAPTLPAAGDAPPAKPRRKMTDWLNAQAGAGPVTPPPADEVPDWLRSLAGSTGTLTPAAPPEPGSPAAQALGSPAPAGGDLPDWLTSMRTATPLNSDDAPPRPQASPAHRMQSLPTWMRTESDDLPAPAAPPEASAAPPVTPEAPAVELPAPEAPADSTDGDETPAWLRAIITPGAADETIPVPAKPKKKKMTDWLGNQPPPPTEAVAPDADLPDWLKALSAGDTVAAAAASSSSVAEGLPDWLKPADGLPSDGLPLPGAATDADLPDWLRGVSAEPAPPPSAAAPELPEPAAPETMAAPPPTPVSAPEPEALAPAPQATAPAAELPEWLTALTPAAAGAAPAALDDATLDWLNTLSAEPAPAEAAGAPAPAEAAAPPAAEATLAASEAEALDLGSAALPAEAPAWLDELKAASLAPATPAASGPGPAPDTSGAEPTPEAELPDWLKTMRGQAPAAEPASDDMPEWLRAMRGLPTTETEPAFADAAAATAEPGAPAAADVTLVGGRPAAAPDTGQPAVINAAPDAAALPAWLASMRPVDIAQAATGAADSYEETLGVLAGMRGVLRAEPAVALPQRAAPAVNRLEVSEQHSAHARLLAELQQTEAAAVPRPGSARRVAQSVERWVVFALLAAAIIAAQFYGPGLFAPPTGQQPAAAAAYQQLVSAGAQSHAPGTLPRPALIAFDYDPSQQGELNPAVVVVLRQLLGAGVPVVGLSIRPAGAAVGQLLLTQVVRDLSAEGQFSYTYGTHYLNLGYLPGGPVGLLQFATAPRSAFTNDFTEAYGDAPLWNAPAVAQVDALDKFSLIVLVSGAPEATRAWIEQAQLGAPNVPVIAVVSAGAEPLVRPYLTAPSAAEAPSPQLDGLVVGLGGAAVLEQQISRPAAASAAWPGLGGGLLAAASLILLGNLVLGLPALLRRRR
ncbi:MAG: hypothetical protein IT317_04045 [Anaerolineales bacterium]|nr:hypothetical protein [Anaerolineales bacterium]